MTEIKKKIKNFLEFNANENAVLRGRNAEKSAYIKRKNTEKSHINNTKIKLIALENNILLDKKYARRNIKLGVKVNEIKTNKTKNYKESKN